MPEGRGHHPADRRDTPATGRYTPDDVGPAAPRHAITFGPGAVLVGFLVGLVTVALAVVLSFDLDTSLAREFVLGVIGFFLLILWYGFMIGICTGLPLGIVLGFLLRPVRNQWIHVLVFFAGFGGVALVTLPLTTASSVTENLPAALVIAAVGALARASVWKLVRVRET